jgi:hypothetical protein
VKAVAAPLPLTSLADDVAALDQMLERVEGPVVVVGNAYAGAVIASTSSEKIASLVYIAALAPDEGETVGDIFYRVEPHPQAGTVRGRRHRAGSGAGDRVAPITTPMNRRSRGTASTLRPGGKGEPSWLTSHTARRTWMA